MNINKIARLTIPIHTILVAIILLFSGCEPSLSDNDYLTMTVQNNVADFSFEYRAYYRDVAGPRIVCSETSLFTYVTISAKKITTPVSNPGLESEGEIVDLSYVPASISIQVGDLSRSPLSAAERIENTLESWNHWPNFELLEHKPVMLDGVQAELIACQIDGFFVGPDLKYKAAIYFDHNGLYWLITLEADNDLAEMVRADLEHLIQTFQIISSSN